MSIHFRSRISNGNANPTIVNTPGWCCKTNSAVNSAAECIGGGFIQNGSAGQCTTPGTCTSFTGDIPGACCYWKLEQGEYYQVCETTDNGLDCLNKNQGTEENLHATFYAGQDCISNGGNIVCNGVNLKNENSECLSDDNSGCFNSDNIIGNCCQIVSGNSICSLATKPECADGVWTPPKNTRIKSCNTAPCVNIFIPSGRTPPSTTLVNVTQAEYSFKQLPEIGAPYQGGIYVGTFTENTTVVYGNRNTGMPQLYDARGGGTRSWILIADLNDLSLNKFNTEQETGVNLLANPYDGWYNTSTYSSTLYTTVYAYKENSFTDWYVPSMDELALYFKNIKLSTSVYKDAHLKNGNYLSSTPYSLGGTQTINGNQYMYVQNSLSNEYGKVSLLNRKQNVNIRLFRRIYLT